MLEITAFLTFQKMKGRMHLSKYSLKNRPKVTAFTKTIYIVVSIVFLT